MKKNLEQILNRRSFVIWGLKDFSHSHSYIHANFLRVLSRHKVNVQWLENNALNNSFIKPGSIVLFVNHDSDKLQFERSNSYIGHNCHKKTAFQEFLGAFPEKGLNYYFHSKQAIGIQDPGGSIARYEEHKRSIFQPYGTPLNQSEFNNRPIAISNTKNENWVGSVWQDANGGGNVDILQEYSSVLSKHMIRLRAFELGYLSRSRSNNFIEGKLIRNSYIAASLHTPEQVDNGYLACRAFKAISFGRILHTNQESFKEIFSDSINACSDLDELVYRAIALTPKQSSIMHAKTIEILGMYTYENGIIRLINALDGKW